MKAATGMTDIQTDDASRNTMIDTQSIESRNILKDTKFIESHEIETVIKSNESRNFLNIPIEIQLYILKLALEDNAPRIVVLSRVPKSQIVDQGIYGTPHPFLSVSTRFRQLTLMAQPWSFALHFANGAKLIPGRVLCNLEKDTFIVHQSVLEYGPELTIPDLTRTTKPIVVLCCRPVTPEAAYAMFNFGGGKLIYLAHAALYVTDGFRKRHVISRDGLWADAEWKIINDLMSQYAAYRTHPNVPMHNAPTIRWVTTSPYTQSYILTRTTGMRGAVFRYFKRLNDKFEVSIHRVEAKLRESEAEAFRRAHVSMKSFIPHSYQSAEETAPSFRRTRLLFSSNTDFM
jgi:hypothetical protein